MTCCLEKAQTVLQSIAHQQGEITDVSNDEIELFKQTFECKRAKDLLDKFKEASTPTVTEAAGYAGTMFYSRSNRTQLVGLGLTKTDAYYGDISPDDEDEEEQMRQFVDFMLENKTPTVDVSSLKEFCSSLTKRAYHSTKIAGKSLTFRGPSGMTFVRADNEALYLIEMSSACGLNVAFFPFSAQ